MNLIIMNDISKSIILGTDFIDQERITISIPLGDWFTDLNFSEQNLISFDEVTIDSEDYHGKSPATVLAAWSSPYENLKDSEETKVNYFFNFEDFPFFDSDTQIPSGLKLLPHLPFEEQLFHTLAPCFPNFTNKPVHVQNMST